MSSHVRYTLQDKAFDIFNKLLMVLMCFSMAYPFLYLLTISLSPADASFTEVRIIPRAIDFSSYKRVLSSEYILLGLYNSIFRTVLGTALSLVAIICTAYPLSKKYFPNRGFWMGFIVFTMFFSGGLIPSYMLVKGLGFIDRIWALVLPGLIPSFTMIIVRNFFMSIPSSMEESARIDGANDISILFRIIIPISTPIIATVVLWLGVGHWNAWFDSLIYIQETKKQVLQVVLRRIVLEGSQEIVDMNTIFNDDSTLTPETIKAAAVMVTTLPIIMLYPFAQKYFIQGIMVGSIKG